MLSVGGYRQVDEDIGVEERARRVERDEKVSNVAFVALAFIVVCSLTAMSCKSEVYKGWCKAMSAPQVIGFGGSLLLAFAIVRRYCTRSAYDERGVKRPECYTTPEDAIW